MKRGKGLFARAVHEPHASLLVSGLLYEVAACLTSVEFGIWQKSQSAGLFMFNFLNLVLGSYLAICRQKQTQEIQRLKDWNEQKQKAWREMNEFLAETKQNISRPFDSHVN